MTAATIQAKPDRKLPFSRVLVAGLIAIVAASVANVIVGWLGKLILPVDPSFAPLASWQPAVVLTSILLVLATIVFLVINAFATSPVRIFNIVALVALIISLIPDVLMLFSSEPLPNLGTPTWGAAVILMVQHVVAYLITVWAFTRWAQQG